MHIYIFKCKRRSQLDMSPLSCIVEHGVQSRHMITPGQMLVPGSSNISGQRGCWPLSHYNWPASASSLAVSLLPPLFPLLSIFLPPSTLSPIMINELVSPPPLLLLLLIFLLFLQHLVGTEAKRSGGMEEEGGLRWLIGWRTGGDQPGVSYGARHHINQPDVFTQACLPKPGHLGQQEAS